METFYHGTLPKYAGRIRAEGFRVGAIDLFGDGDLVVIGGGNIGFGSYLTTDWRIALWFGPAILKIHLQRGTRILRLGSPPDKKVLLYLRKEFGKSLFDTETIDTVIPRNKRLTFSEYVALLSYHYEKTSNYFWKLKTIESHKRHTRKWMHVAAMHKLGAGLQRFGIHGFGEPKTHNGIVIFQPDRILVDELVVVVPDTTWQELHKSESFDRIRSLNELKGIAAGRYDLPA